MKCEFKDDLDVCCLHGCDYDGSKCPYVARCDCVTDDPTADDITAMIFEISQMIGEMRTEIKALRAEVRKGVKNGSCAENEGRADRKV